MSFGLSTGMDAIQSNFKWSVERLNGLADAANVLFDKKLSRFELEKIFAFSKKLIIRSERFADDKGVYEFILKQYKKSLEIDKRVDIKQMLIDQMNGVVTDYTKESLEGDKDNSVLSIPSAADLFAMTRVLNRDSLLRDSIVLFDTRYQNRSNTDRSRFVFSVVTNTKTKTEGSGIVITLPKIENIVEMEIFPMSIPYSTAADSWYNKVSLTVHEMTASSIDSYEDTRFHFMFNSAKNGNLLDLTPVNPLFRFHSPISTVSDFTVYFGSPLTRILFDKDTLTTASFDYTANPMTITFSENHSLITGDLVYLTDFTTADPVKDMEIISAINTPRGHQCTRISATEISINIDANLIQYPDTAHVSNVYLGSKRIMFMIRFRFLADSAFV